MASLQISIIFFVNLDKHELHMRIRATAHDLTSSVAVSEFNTWDNKANMAMTFHLDNSEKSKSYYCKEL